MRSDRVVDSAWVAKAIRVGKQNPKANDDLRLQNMLRAFAIACSVSVIVVLLILWSALK
jgi:hypothetical protein